MIASIKSWFSTILGMLLLFVLIGIIIKGCQFVDQLIGKDEETEEIKQMIIVNGQNGVIVQDTFFSFNKESYNELSSYIVSSNTEAISRMMANGRVIAINKGEVVTMIDSGYTTSLVEIRSTGERGYIAAEMVRSSLD
ncbi:hypothetical protein [Bacillus sp. AG4(2022)]|uniref:hypothetical protein n=1 Tax=Bacillus sp. AG4(2022) TaxID=2962594 RepID=UPI002882A0C4|nr:hypothetical protein [Bacillus sp. AG4(2022)]MDT0161612.1 hypothetical protein [Bacillus sp. AG4(2022)]